MDAWVQQLTATPAPCRHPSGISKDACTGSHGLPVREQTEESNTDFTGFSPNKEGKVMKTQYRNKEMENTTEVKQIQQTQKEKAVAAQRLVPERLWWLLLRISSFPLQWILHSLQTHCENGKEKKTGQLPSLLQGSYQSVGHHSTELPTTFVWQTSQASSWFKLLAPLLTERKAELLPSEPPL